MSEYNYSCVNFVIRVDFVVPIYFAKEQSGISVFAHFIRH